MSTRTVSAGSMADAIMDELQNYSQDITDMLKDEVKAAAKDTVKEIKDTAPVMTGDYKKGWTSKVTYETTDDIRMSVHNPKEYRLTHLLEYGHAKVNGGRVAAIPHIKPAEENIAETLKDKVKVGIRNR